MLPARDSLFYHSRRPAEEVKQLSCRGNPGNMGSNAARGWDVGETDSKSYRKIFPATVPFLHSNPKAVEAYAARPRSLCHFGVLTFARVRRVGR